MYKHTKLLFYTISGPEAEPASYLMGTGNFFLRGTAAAL
jgi:hypothetical protein